MAFRAQLRIFIEEIIGWDLTDGISHPRVMAKVIAFNAQVEEQGGQNLHAHILVTVAGLPHTHEALVQKLREHPQTTLRGIIKFVEAVKCNDASTDAACPNEFMACNEEPCQKLGQNQFVSVAVPAHIKNTTKPLGFASPEPNTVRCPYSQSDELNGVRNDIPGQAPPAAAARAPAPAPAAGAPPAATAHGMGQAPPAAAARAPAPAPAAGAPPAATAHGMGEHATNECF
ncbi:hypothetical protein CYMTET_42332 [Cymbomonas tetramitiformis]|uniref:Helitron helicase-like domain-containing protein n=1 Tax=Cymbomonas tetramitiformis TaxID=36881 RepID=A0AAE0C5M4_9CHLO|nr:hypothetical protein CYMTET_42334 [Cymbomonas tetramitiformis]KAK3248196.1 hypothetical protein CYMTET_42332 [Cymbomonas tetramitiformis]